MRTASPGLSFPSGSALSRRRRSLSSTDGSTHSRLFRSLPAPTTTTTTTSSAAPSAGTAMEPFGSWALTLRDPESWVVVLHDPLLHKMVVYNARRKQLRVVRSPPSTTATPSSVHNGGSSPRTNAANDLCTSGFATVPGGASTSSISPIASCFNNDLPALSSSFNTPAAMAVSSQPSNNLASGGGRFCPYCYRSLSRTSSFSSSHAEEEDEEEEEMFEAQQPFIVSDFAETEPIEGEDEVRSSVDQQQHSAATAFGKPSSLSRRSKSMTHTISAPGPALISSFMTPSRFLAPNYFRLLTLESPTHTTAAPFPAACTSSSRTTTTSTSTASSTTTTTTNNNRYAGLRNEAFNTGYYDRFFVEEKLIGRGAFGSVFLCRHMLDCVDLGCYAVKKVAVGNDVQRLKDVLKEVRALEKLHHPNCIAYKHSWLERSKVADFGPSDVPFLFILMEYANQGTNLYDFVMNKRRSRDSTMDATKIQRLKQWRREQRRENAPPGRDNNPLRDADGEYLNETLIWNFFLDILSGLSHLHAHNICHNDLKPQNLLLHDPLQASSLHFDPTERSTRVVEEGLTVVLTDFGSVKPILMSQASDHKEQIAKALERTGNTGTIEYMAPEVLLTDPLSGRYKHDYSEKSDVWSLGVILYFLCYSASPFASVNQETAPQQSGKDRIEDMEKEILSFRHLDSFPDTPQRAPVLKRLIEWMMNKDPQDRPTVDELVSFPPIRERLFSRMQASSAPSAKYSVPASSPPNSVHTTALRQDAISASALILAKPPTSMSVPASPYGDETVVRDKHNQEPTSVTKDKNGNVLSLLTHQTTGESRLMVLTPKRRISNSTILNGLLWVIKSSPRRLFLQLDLIITKQAFIAIFLFVKVMLLLERFEPAPTILLYCFIVLSALNILSCHKKRASASHAILTMLQWVHVAGWWAVGTGLDTTTLFPVIEYLLLSLLELFLLFIMGLIYAVPVKTAHKRRLS